jgi:hypothetical protein
VDAEGSKSAEGDAVAVATTAGKSKEEEVFCSPIDDDSHVKKQNVI